MDLVEVAETAEAAVEVAVVAMVTRKAMANLLVRRSWEVMEAEMILATSQLSALVIHPPTILLTMRDGPLLTRSPTR